ncbi:hypothetical protein ACFLS1_04880 [Verrucomicrobiota bacterium]
MKRIMGYMFVAFLTICLSSLTAAPKKKDNNLMINGSFDDPEDPLKGWCVDWRWNENANYMFNHEACSIIKQGVRPHVLRVKKSDASEKIAEIKIDSPVVPFELGCKYKIQYDYRTMGGGGRIYVIGYYWAPGVMPNKNPHRKELRPCYRGGIMQPQSFKPTYWKTVTAEFPAKDISKLGMQHLERVELIGVHFYSMNGNEWFIDNVRIEKTK